MANILAPACAVGVACTFAAPLGGRMSINLDWKNVLIKSNTVQTVPLQFFWFSAS